jgi:hypothetical protein
MNQLLAELSRVYADAGSIVLLRGEIDSDRAALRIYVLASLFQPIEVNYLYYWYNWRVLRYRRKQAQRELFEFGVSMSLDNVMNVFRHLLLRGRHDCDVETVFEFSFGHG